MDDLIIRIENLEMKIETLILEMKRINVLMTKEHRLNKNKITQAIQAAIEHGYEKASSET